MSKIKQDKIYLTQDENGNLKMDDEMGKLLFGDPNPKYKLVRERDNKTKYGHSVAWIEWKENGMFGSVESKPKIGLSCMIDPHPFNFTWLTTSITEIVEQKDNYIKFNTENSVYELWRLKND